MMIDIETNSEGIQANPQALLTGHLWPQVSELVITHTDIVTLSHQPKQENINKTNRNRTKTKNMRGLVTRLLIKAFARGTILKSSLTENTIRLASTLSQQPFNVD